MINLFGIRNFSPAQTLNSENLGNSLFHTCLLWFFQLKFLLHAKAFWYQVPTRIPKSIPEIIINDNLEGNTNMIAICSHVFKITTKLRCFHNTSVRFTTNYGLSYWKFELVAWFSYWKIYSQILTAIKLKFFIWCKRSYAHFKWGTVCFWVCWILKFFFIL